MRVITDVSVSGSCDYGNEEEIDLGTAVQI